MEILNFKMQLLYCVFAQVSYVSAAFKYVTMMLSVTSLTFNPIDR
jgi:hypothetical protein